MPRRKKKAVEMDISEALQKMFPKAVRQKMEETALQSRKRTPKKKGK
jgi:hypothetical protein